MDHQQQPYAGLRELALFAGAGGGILGGKLLGWGTVCAVEWNAYAAAVLCARQNQGLLENFPIWDDVQTFDGKPWRGIVDVVSGGFPCQDISEAGYGVGICGERSALWSEMARIVSEIRPKFVFVENSPMLTSRGLHRVLGDLAKMRYDSEYGSLSAWQLGAIHERERTWIVAANSDMRRSGRREQQQNSKQKARSVYWEAEPSLSRVDDGVAFRVDRLKAIGNGQVPAVAASAFIQLAGRL